MRIISKLCPGPRDPLKILRNHFFRFGSLWIKPQSNLAVFLDLCRKSESGEKCHLRKTRREKRPWVLIGLFSATALAAEIQRKTSKKPEKNSLRGEFYRFCAYSPKKWRERAKLASLDAKGKSPGSKPWVLTNYTAEPIRWDSVSAALAPSPKNP